MTTLGVMGRYDLSRAVDEGRRRIFMKPPAPRRPGYNHIDFGRVKRLYFRGDAAFANPEVYEFFEAEGMSYTIRLPANRVLQDKIGHLLKRPVGRPPQEVRRYYSSFSYQAGSWNKPRRVVAKVEWRPRSRCRGRCLRKSCRSSPGYRRRPLRHDSGGVR